MGQLGEPFVALGTRVRLIACVNSHVLSQIARVEEGFRAHLAPVILVPTFVFVNSSRVYGQCDFRIEHLTNKTRKIDVLGQTDAIFC